MMVSLSAAVMVVMQKSAAGKKGQQAEQTFDGYFGYRWGGLIFYQFQL